MIAKAQNTPLERVRVLQRKLYLAAKANPMRKFGVLYDKVCREDVLRAAYAQVRANQGAPGVDRQTFEEIENGVGIDAFLNDIPKSSLGNGTSLCRSEGCLSPRPMERNDRSASRSLLIV